MDVRFADHASTYGHGTYYRVCSHSFVRVTLCSYITFTWHSYNIVGYCLMSLGETEQAREIFMRSNEYTLSRPAFHRLNPAQYYLQFLSLHVENNVTLMQSDINMVPTAIQVELKYPDKIIVCICCHVTCCIAFWTRITAYTARSTTGTTQMRQLVEVIIRITSISLVQHRSLLPVISVKFENGECVKRSLGRTDTLSDMTFYRKYFVVYNSSVLQTLHQIVEQMLLIFAKINYAPIQVLMDFQYKSIL